MVDIPQDVYDTYHSFADDFINKNFGVTCRCIYPAKPEFCDNCIFDPIGKKSSNRYKHGGPAPFSIGKCPVCGGTGYKPTVPTGDNIKMRVYYDAKDFIKIAGLEIPADAIQVEGFLADLTKFLQAELLEINKEQAGRGINIRYQKLGPPVPHGLKRDRYFIAFLKQA